MKKTILFGLILISLFFIAGCTTLPICPESCDDDNPCTNDFCSNQTDYKCEHKKITNCCLSDEDCSTNKVCENNKCGYSDDFLSKEAVKVAQGFSIAWQRDDYGLAYDYFIPELKRYRSKENFVKFVEVSQESNEINLIYDKVVLQDKDLAYAYYSFSGDSIFQPKTPALEMRFINNEWKINAFGDFFIKNCPIEDCKYNFDLLVKNCILQHRHYHYSECVEITKKTYDGVFGKGSPSFRCDETTNFKCRAVK